MYQIQVKNDKGDWHGERRWYFNEEDAKEIAELTYRSREYRVVETFPLFHPRTRHLVRLEYDFIELKS